MAYKTSTLTIILAIIMCRGQLISLMGDNVNHTDGESAKTKAQAHVSPLLPPRVKLDMVWLTSASPCGTLEHHPS